MKNSREDVIRILPCVGIRNAKVDCKTCPYNETPGKVWENGCVIGQERLVKDAIELLMRQKTVRPILLRKSSRGRNYDDYTCPVCRTDAFYGQGWCAECGSEFEWTEGSK